MGNVPAALLIPVHSDHVVVLRTFLNLGGMLGCQPPGDKRLHDSDRVWNMRTSETMRVVPIKLAATSRGPCKRLHSRVPVIARISRPPAKVSVSNIQALDMPLPLCRLARVAHTLASFCSICVSASPCQYSAFTLRLGVMSVTRQFSGCSIRHRPREPGWRVFSG